MEDLVWLDSGVHTSRMLCLVAGVILVYDHFCSLDREIELILKRRLGSVATLLFMVNRYSPYIYLAIAMEEYRTPKDSTWACRNWDIAACAFMTLSFASCELTLALRTWAMWRLSRRVLLFFAALLCVKIPMSIVVLTYLLKGARYIHATPFKVICVNPTAGSFPWETLMIGVFLMAETAIAILTFVKAIEAQHSSSRWYFKIHYMGVVYYFYNLLMGIMNLIGTVYFRNVGMIPFFLLQGAVLCAVCTRVMFIAHEPSEFAITAASEVSRISFAAPGLEILSERD